MDASITRADVPTVRRRADDTAAAARCRADAAVWTSVLLYRWWGSLLRGALQHADVALSLRTERAFEAVSALLPAG
eukprot:410446-Prymnesium_polylepis.3